MENRAVALLNDDGQRQYRCRCGRRAFGVIAQSGVPVAHCESHFVAVVDAYRALGDRLIHDPNLMVRLEQHRLRLTALRARASGFGYRAFRKAAASLL